MFCAKESTKIILSYTGRVQGMAFSKDSRYFAWITSESPIYGFLHLYLKISLTPHQPTCVFVVSKMRVHDTSKSPAGDRPTCLLALLQS